MFGIPHIAWWPILYFIFQNWIVALQMATRYLFKINKQLKVIELNILKFLNRMASLTLRKAMFPLQKKGDWRPVAKPFMIEKMEKLPFELNRKLSTTTKRLPEVKYF